MNLHAHCIDGPLEGTTFTIRRCPPVVRCVRAADGTTDILNEDDDAPRLDEVVHWYRWDGHAAGFMCARGRGSQSATLIHLRHAPDLRALRPADPVNPGARA